MITVRGVNHVSLRISDVARSSEFYGKFLGLKRVTPPTIDREKQNKFRDEVVAAKNVSSPNGGIWFAAGDTQLHLIATPGQTERTGSPFGPHLALEVEDFEETKRAVYEAGVAVLESPEGLGLGRQIWISDPDGNTIELWAKEDDRA